MTGVEKLYKWAFDKLEPKRKPPAGNPEFIINAQCYCRRYNQKEDKEHMILTPFTFHVKDLARFYQVPRDVRFYPEKEEINVIFMDGVIYVIVYRFVKLQSAFENYHSK